MSAWATVLTGLAEGLTAAGIAVAVIVVAAFLAFWEPRP